MSRQQYYTEQQLQYESSDEDSDDTESHCDHDYDVPVVRGKKYINKGRWTKEEDDKLKKICIANGTRDWKMIANYFVDRTDIQCQHRWQKVLNPDLIKGPWTKEEDEKVLQLVKIHGPKRWTLISKHLKGRTGKQCRERWHNHLNPDIKKSAWTEEEDRLIYQLHKKMGNRWAEIAKYLPGRTDNAIKNHWNSTMRRKFENEEENRFMAEGKFTQAYTPSTSNNLQGFQPVRLFQNVTQATPTGSVCSGASVVVHAQNLGTLSSSGKFVVKSSGVHIEGSTPQQWKVIDSEGLLSPLRCIPELAEAMQCSDKFQDMTTYELLSGADIEPGVTPIKFTRLHKKGAFDYRFDGHAISSLKEAGGGLIPITSPVVSKKLTTPSTPAILRKSKRKRANPQRITHDTSVDSEPEIFHHTRNLKNEPKTPKGTPIKSLPFSPSQFLNSPDLPFVGKLTSTPVCSLPDKATPITFKMSTAHIKSEDGEGKIAFRTPKIRRSIWEANPRTPTPFKNALAEIEKSRGMLKMQPETPTHLVEDLNEVIARDTGTNAYSTEPGAYAAVKRTSKENESPSKKARKSLDNKWSTPGEIPLFTQTGDLFVPETPSKSLIGDSSIIFSPPSILKDTLNGDSLNEAFALPHSPAPRQKKHKSGQHIRFEELSKKEVAKIKLAWESVACGRTLDQLQMTEQAKFLLKTNNIKPRSLLL